MTFQDILKKAVKEFESQVITPKGVINTIREWERDYNTPIKFNFVIGHTYEELVGDGYMTQYMTFFEDDTGDYLTADDMPEDVLNRKYYIFSVDDYEGDEIITFELEKI